MVRKTFIALSALLSINSNVTASYFEQKVSENEDFVKRKLTYFRPSQESLDSLPRLSINNLNAANLPKSIDLRESGFMPKIYDQGGLGSCTANSGCCALQYAFSKAGVKDYYPSRMFHYYFERELDGTTSEDVGSGMHNAVEVAEQKGVCQESTWPYKDDGYTFKLKPSEQAINEASHYKVTASHGLVKVQHKNQDNPLDSLQDLKSVLAAGTPVMFGFNWYDSFSTSFNVGKKGIVPLPKNNGKIITEDCDGGHAVVAVGYNDTVKDPYVIIRNSWGASWGDAGYGYMNQRFLTMKGESKEYACYGFYAIDSVKFKSNKNSNEFVSVLQDQNNKSCCFSSAKSPNSESNCEIM